MIKLLLTLASDVEICPGLTLENLLQCKGFAILHQNIRGLVGKKNLLVNILFNHSSIDILGLSETWMTPDCFYDLEISGYKLERRDRLSGIGGGVGAYIKDSVRYICRYDLEREDCGWKFILNARTVSSLLLSIDCRQDQNILIILLRVLLKMSYLP